MMVFVFPVRQPAEAVMNNINNQYVDGPPSFVGGGRHAPFTPKPYAAVIENDIGFLIIADSITSPHAQGKNPQNHVKHSNL